MCVPERTARGAHDCVTKPSRPAALCAFTSEAQRARRTPPKQPGRHAALRFARIQIEAARATVRGRYPRRSNSAARVLPPSPKPRIRLDHAGGVPGDAQLARKAGEINLRTRGSDVFEQLRGRNFKIELRQLQAGMLEEPGFRVFRQAHALRIDEPNVRNAPAPESSRRWVSSVKRSSSETISTATPGLLRNGRAASEAPTSSSDELSSIEAQTGCISRPETGNELLSVSFAPQPSRERSPVPGGRRIPDRGTLPRRSASLPIILRGAGIQTC